MGFFLIFVDHYLWCSKKNTAQLSNNGMKKKESFTWEHIRED